MAKLLGLLLKHLFPRLLFLVHGLLSIVMVVELSGNTNYWWLSICLALIVVEGVYNAVVRKGREFDWVCPSAFFYCIVLITTLAIYRMKSVSCILNDISETQCQTKFEPTSFSAKLFNSSSDQQRASIIEQTGVLVLIIGRWLLPKGSISREQFSQILLIYVGTAADIVEVSELFGDDKVKSLKSARRSIYIGLMVVWGWSVMQFSLTIALPEQGLKGSDDEDNDDEKGNEDKAGVKWRQTNQVAPMSYLHYKSILKQGWDVNKPAAASPNGAAKKHRMPFNIRDDPPPHDQDTEDDDNAFRIRTKDIKDCFVKHLELISILIPVVMQDGPFFIFRFVLIVHYNVVTEMIILLTCKNALVVVVQIYRILIMYCAEPKGKEPDLEDPSVRMRLALATNNKLSGHSLQKATASLAVQALSRMHLKAAKTEHTK